MVAQPHFLLFCDTHHSHVPSGAQGAAAGLGGGRWHFVLEQLDGPERLEAADSELSMNRERLALLSVVRGLEALEQPSQVTLVTTSRYVSRGLRYGLNTWRDSNYTWERFGEQRPVRNSDLWRRVDTALQFHGVKCRLIQAGLDSLEAEIAPNRQLAIPTAAPVAPWLTAPALLAPGAGSLPTSCPAPVFTHFEPLANFGETSAPPPVGFAACHPVGLGGDVSRLTTLRKPSRTEWLSKNFQRSWWNLAASWIRWWRGRFQHRPVFYGT